MIQSTSPQNPSPLARIPWMPVLFIAIAAVAGALALTRAHPLLSMTNDRAQYSVFPKPDPRVNGPLHGVVVLGNNGLLPYTYLAQVTDGLPGEHLNIKRRSDGKVLYSGPPPSDPVELGSMDPGQRVVLVMDLTRPGVVGQPQPVSFAWTARAAPPLWAVVGILLLAALALAALLYFGGLLGRPRVGFGFRSPGPPRTVSESDSAI